MFHLMAAKSIKLVLELILQKNRQKAENRKADQKADAINGIEIIFRCKPQLEPGRGDWVHGAAHLLEGGARLQRLASQEI